MTGAIDVTVSPDGRNVYAVSHGSDAVAVFDRNLSNGTITQKAGTAGCVSDSGHGGECANGRALLNPQGIEVSSDGDHVYVASAQSDAVVVFDRNPTTGAITQKAGTAGCVRAFAGEGCAVGRGLDGATGRGASRPTVVTCTPPASSPMR